MSTRSMLAALTLAVFASLVPGAVVWASVAVYGTVFDAETGEPVSKATVAAHIHTEVFKQLTSAQGAYLMDLPAGSGYTITYSAPGYKPQSITKDLPNQFVLAFNCYLAPEKTGPYKNPIASIDIDQTNDWVYVWYKDGTVTYGTPMDLDRYSSATTFGGTAPIKSYSVPEYQWFLNIAGIAMKDKGHVWTFYDIWNHGTGGVFIDLDRHMTVDSSGQPANWQWRLGTHTGNESDKILDMAMNPAGLIYTWRANKATRQVFVLIGDKDRLDSKMGYWRWQDVPRWGLPVSLPSATGTQLPMGIAFNSKGHVYSWYKGGIVAVGQPRDLDYYVTRRPMVSSNITTGMLTRGEEDDDPGATVWLELEWETSLQTVEGEGVRLPAGGYWLSPVSSTSFRMESAKTEEFWEIQAIETTHENSTDLARATTVPSDSDAYHILLLLEGGKALQATGSLSGVLARGELDPVPSTVIDRYLNRGETESVSAPALEED